MKSENLLKTKLEEKKAVNLLIEIRKRKKTANEIYSLVTRAFKIVSFNRKNCIFFCLL